MFFAQISQSEFQLLSGVDQKSQMKIDFDFEQQQMTTPKQNKLEIEIQQNEIGFYQMTAITNLSLFQKKSFEESQYEKYKQNNDNQGSIQIHDDKCHWYQQLDIFNNDIKYNHIDISYELSFKKDQQDQQFLSQNQFTPEQKQYQQNIKTKSNDRRLRVQRYFSKRAKRSFSKKISYECRKNVADKRFRIKGRFVNKKIAQQIIKNELFKQLQFGFPNAVNEIQ